MSVHAAPVSPLTPADCDLRDFRFMPLDVLRLRDSDLSALETPEACWAAVQLWGAAWHQVPAASLPDDDRILAQLAGYGRVVKEWLRVKAGALRGFVRCTDGRLYHPVVAEKAIEAWESKIERKWRTECARIKKRNQRTGENVSLPELDDFKASLLAVVPRDIPPMSHEPPEDVPRDSDHVSPECPQGNSLQGTGIGTGTGTGTLKERKKEPSVPTKDVSRGTRIPADWAPSDIDRAFAIKHRVRDVDLMAEHFLNYWLAKSGPRALKRDWTATWRNWVLKDAELRARPADDAYIRSNIQ
jgi:hypothetical protein